MSLSVSGTLWAQSKPVARFGEQQCSRWGQVNQRTVHQAWLLAYLTGVNSTYNSFAAQQHSVLAQLSPPDQAMAWMDRYCAAHPAKKFTSGAATLFLELAQATAAGTTTGATVAPTASAPK